MTSAADLLPFKGDRIDEPWLQAGGRRALPPSARRTGDPGMGSGAQPAWLEAWCADGTDPAEALARFDGLGPVAMEEMFGRWRGRSCPTGHPLDGVLEALGWYGKAFAPPDLAHPLLFRTRSGGIAPLDPARLPDGIAMRWPGLARSGPVQRAFAVLEPVLTTHRPGAHLKRIRYRGVESTAMIYDRKPITDHFRKIAPGSVLGLMDMRGAPPFYFHLAQDRPRPTGALG
jgi:hypothetical protein